ncbi:MAG: hypothetical protein KA436_09605 [Oligoflexales bacterium]|nr:hypothetical protein [Oligoflexales bacterium]
MKNDLHIKFRTKENYFEDLEKALKGKSKSIQPENIIYFESYKDFQKFLFPRLGILLAIKTHNPKSIYELSKIVERDVSTLVKDCNALELIGFIRLEESNDARGSKIPKLKFNYNRIVVHAPNLGQHAVLLDAA